MEYLSLRGALTPDEYVAELGEYLSAEEGAKLASKLALLDQKIRFYGEMPPESLGEWADARALESRAWTRTTPRSFGNLSLSIRFVKSSVREYPRTEIFRRSFSSIRACTTSSIFSSSKGAGGDSFSLADEFISLAGAYADPAKRDEYAAFADAFRAGTSDAYAYLPPEAAVYLVLMDYYGEYVSQGRALRGDEEMELFLARYADEGMRDVGARDACGVY